MNLFTLKVFDIRKETNDTVTLCFKQPGLRKIKYIAGQYITLIFRINGRRYLRPYSFSSSPLADSLLEITVKRVPFGIVSNHIHDTVAVGDSIEVLQPMGDFICEELPGQLFLWGAGSGITPLMSIAKQTLVTSDKTIVNLIYGNRNHESTIFLKQINQLQYLYPKNFLVQHFHTQLTINHNIPRLIEGRIDENKALGLLNQLGVKKDSLHYICGPSGLKESVKNALLQVNIEQNQIFSEDFELNKDPNEFKNIQTQNVKLRFEEREFEVEVIKGRSILECALDAGIELPYSCQTGNCNTCKGKLVKGHTKMIGLSKEREDLISDEYLLCCTYPLSNNVYIEIA